MEDIVRLDIIYNGYIEVDKNDIVINEINEETGKFKKVNTKTMTKEEIIEGVRAGQYYVDLKANLNIALDGQQDCTVEDHEC